MLNKVEVGNRIKALRKKLTLTQVELAKKLNVSPQAVSKWELAQAIPDIEVLLNLSWLFKVSINEIIEGNNLLRKIANRSFEINEIAYFVPMDERDYNVKWAKDIINGKWIKKNWEWHKANISVYKEVAKEILSHGGLILELGTGPGGGFIPDIILDDLSANIIISDLSPTVVKEWKNFFSKGLNPPNAHYAALDNCDLPFEDNTIDVISAGGGFGNTEGDKYKVLTEIYRVLKPGGLYVAGDGFVTNEMLHSLPESTQKILIEKRPDIFEDYYEATVTAGFKTINNKIGVGWSTKDDDSQIATLAKSLGVELIFSSYLRYCTK